MSHKSTGSHRTRHVDVRYHYVREYVEEGTVKIVFVKSAENVADIFMKNVEGDCFERHTDEFMDKGN